MGKAERREEASGKRTRGRECGVIGKAGRREGARG